MYIIYYIVGINLITYLFFWMDKVKAKRKSWRISEKTLFILSFIGGSLGGFVAMNQLRHKTQKSEFKNVMYIILTIQLVLIGFITYQLYQNK